MTKVLVGIDGSDVAVGAARRGFALLDVARRDDVEITLLRVVTPVVNAIGVASGAPTPLAVDPALDMETSDALERDAASDLDAASRALGVKATRRVVVGHPGEELCAAAREMDVVIVGSHGSGLLKRVLLGSVSHYVLHHCDTPVLVVRVPRAGRSGA